MVEKNLTKKSCAAPLFAALELANPATLLSVIRGRKYKKGYGCVFID